MIIKDLEYHKKELHKITEQVKQLKKDLGLAKRCGDMDMLNKMLKSYRYWVTRTKKGKNTNRAKYVRKRIKIFYKLTICKTFHQTVVVMIMKKGKKEGG